MPRIPTRSTRTVSPSGRTGEVPLPVSIAKTGAADEARGYAMLGAGISTIGRSLGQINLRFIAEENANELSKLDRSATEFMDRRLTDISQMTDTAQMRQYWDETVKAMEENFKGTNDAVNDDLYRRLNSKITQGSVQVNNMWRNQIVRNTDTETRNMMDQAIQKNLPEQYEEAVQRRARVGLDTPAEQEQLRQAFPVNVYLAEKMKEMEEYPENVALELSQVRNTITQNGQTVELTMEQKQAINTLQRRAEQQQYAMEAKANHERIQRADTFDRQYTDRLLAGEVTIGMIDELIANPDLTPARKTSLRNTTTALLNEMSKPKEYREDEKAQAYVDVLNIADPAQRELAAIAKSPIIGYATARGIVDDIRKPTSKTEGKNLLRESIDTTVSNMRELEKAAIKDEGLGTGAAAKAIADMNRRLVIKQAAAYRYLEENADLSIEQLADGIDGIMAPIREQTGEALVKNAGIKWTWPWNFPGTTMKVQAGGFGGGYIPAPEQKHLTTEIAVEYLRRANGDRSLAKRMAAADGYIE